MPVVRAVDVDTEPAHAVLARPDALGLADRAGKVVGQVQQDRELHAVPSESSVTTMPSGHWRSQISRNSANSAADMSLSTSAIVASGPTRTKYGAVSCSIRSQSRTSAAAVSMTRRR